MKVEVDVKRIVQEIEQLQVEKANTPFTEEKDELLKEIQFRRRVLNYIIQDEETKTKIFEYIAVHDIFAEYMHTEEDIKRMQMLKNELFGGS